MPPGLVDDLTPTVSREASMGRAVQQALWAQWELREFARPGTTSISILGHWRARAGTQADAPEAQT